MPTLFYCAMSSDVQRTSTSVQRPLEWMRFEPVKFGYLVDELSRSQVGTVMKLILRIWEFGPMLEDTVRTVSGVDFEVVRTRMFEVDGKLSFEMVEDARSYGKRTRNQRVEAGIASAEKRAANSTTVQRPFNGRSTGVLSKSISSSDSGKERARKKPEPAPHPFDSPEYLAAFEAFDQMRIAKRKPMTDRARQLILADLSKMGEADAILSLNTSTRSGWTDVYPPKKTIQFNGQQTDEERRAERNRIIAERYAGQ